MELIMSLLQTAVFFFVLTVKFNLRLTMENIPTTLTNANNVEDNCKIFEGKGKIMHK